MVLRRLIAFACVLSLSMSLLLPRAFAAQGTGCMPTTGTISGLTFAQDVNAAIAALISSNSGATAPATDCTSLAVKGQIWLDTSATPNILKQYDGASWLVVGFIDTTNHVWSPPVGGGTATVASASTTDLWSVPQSTLTVSGTTPITALANASAVPGTMKIIKFSGVLTLTYNGTSLVLPGAVDITTAAGDYALVTALTSTNVAVVSYFKADGTAVVNPAIPVGTPMFFDGFTVPAKFVLAYGQAIARTDFPDYVTAVTKTQSVTRVSGSAALTSVSDTSRMGAGQNIEGTGIPSGTTVVSVTSSTITMSANASSSGTSNATVFAFGYGAGGDATTVGVRDCRGRTLAGRDDMGGTAASRLTTSGGINGVQLGAVSTNSQVFNIAQANLPNTTISVSGSISGSASVTSTVGDILRNPGGIQAAADGASGGLGTGSSGGSSITSTGSITGTFSGTTGALGSGTAVSRIGPMAISDCIVRVLQ